MPVTTIEWRHDHVRMIDQTLLPGELVHLEITDLEVLAEAIKSLRVRGAPAIGIAAAFGVLLGLKKFEGDSQPDFFTHLRETVSFLNGTRPTAVNLSWATSRMLSVAEQNRSKPVEDIKEILAQEALKIWEEDRKTCRRLGDHGAELVQNFFDMRDRWPDL